MVLEGKGGPGERAVAGADEDSLTMAVDAVLDCTKGIDRSSIDGLYNATTSAPFVEKQVAAAAASALDFGDNIVTADISNSLKSGLTALRLAADAVKAGSAKRIMVSAADSRLGTPLSSVESNSGDGGAALLIGDKDVAASLEGFFSFSTEFTDTWRPATDKFVHVWSERFTVAER